MHIAPALPLLMLQPQPVPDKRSGAGAKPVIAVPHRCGRSEPDQVSQHRPRLVFDPVRRRLRLGGEAVELLDETCERGAEPARFSSVDLRRAMAPRMNSIHRKVKMRVVTIDMISTNQLVALQFGLAQEEVCDLLQLLRRGALVCRPADDMVRNRIRASVVCGRQDRHFFKGHFRSAVREQQISEKAMAALSLGHRAVQIENISTERQRAMI